MQATQHRQHQQVAGAESAVEPVGIAQPGRKRRQPPADRFLQPPHPRLEPGLVALEDLHQCPVEDRWLDRVQRRKHPGDGAGPAIGIDRQQALVPFGDMQHDRAGFEQHQVAVLIGRDLSEGLKRHMRACFIVVKLTLRTS